MCSRHVNVILNSFAADPIVLRYLLDRALDASDPYYARMKCSETPLELLV
jgi:hypothetical protein